VNYDNVMGRRSGVGKSWSSMGDATIEGRVSGNKVSILKC